MLKFTLGPLDSNRKEVWVGFFGSEANWKKRWGKGSLQPAEREFIRRVLGNDPKGEFFNATGWIPGTPSEVRSQLSQLAEELGIKLIEL